MATTPSPIARIGSMPVPVPEEGQTDSDPIGDPGLGLIVAYVAAVLNARAGAAWESVAKGRALPGQGPLVVHTFTHDPNEEEFNPTHTPALFAWRQDGQGEQIAADYHVHASTLVLQWVPVAEWQHLLARRHPFMGAIGKIVDGALYLGRDPAWTMLGDTDPKSATQGSFLHDVAGIWRIGRVSWKRVTLDIPKGDGVARYPTLRFEVAMEELLERAPGDAPYDLAATLTQTGPEGDGITVAFDGEPPE